jgi:hypothetical protein
MVRVWTATAEGAEYLTEYDGLTEALAGTFECWNEEPTGSQLFWFVDEKGNFLATLLRDEVDPEICHVTMPSGYRMRVRCHYVLDAQGHYESTETTVLD